MLMKHRNGVKASTKPSLLYTILQNTFNYGPTGRRVDEACITDSRKKEKGSGLKVLARSLFPYIVLHSRH